MKRVDLILPSGGFQVNGTFGFVYSGFEGVGIGVFSIRGPKLIGSDAAGGKYSGQVSFNTTTGETDIVFDMFVPAGVFLVQGKSPQEIPMTKQNIPVTLPPNFWNGKPIELYVPPGTINVMISRIPDDWAHLANGFSVSINT